MRIGIDLDDTLVNTSKAFDEVLMRNNVTFNKKYSDVWTEKEAEFILKNYFEETVKIAKLNVGAKAAIDYLSSSGHEIIVITARSNHYSNNIEDITLKFIKDNNLKISEIYFGQHEKANKAKELKIDVMIDDNPEIYKSMKAKNIDCILMGDKIKNWYEVIEYIKKKEALYGENSYWERDYRRWI